MLRQSQNFLSLYQNKPALLLLLFVFFQCPGWLTWWGSFGWNQDLRCSCMLKRHKPPLQPSFLINEGDFFCTTDQSSSCRAVIIYTTQRQLFQPGSPTPACLCCEFVCCMAPPIWEQSLAGNNQDCDFLDNCRQNSNIYSFPVNSCNKSLGWTVCELNEMIKDRRVGLIAEHTWTYFNILLNFGFIFEPLN